MLHSLIGLACCALARVEAAFELGLGDDPDLTNFVTRPELKVPRFNITVYDKKALAPGYWFVAPYVRLDQQYFPEKYYQPCQSGPAIYGDDGELIWSGACLVLNNNTCDFRKYSHDGKDALSAVLCAYSHGPIRHGILLDSSYRILKNVTAPPENPDFNMHELNVISNGRRALHLMDRSEFVNLEDLGMSGVTSGYVLDTGFREMDLSTGETLFEWWASKHIAPSESKVKVERIERPYPFSWDYLHGNSISKNGDGDFLFSGRYTDCIYKIDGQTGAVVWRLGGKKSDFVLKDFNFSRQHDAQWVKYDFEIEVISLLDNAADMNNATSSTSSALVVKLDKTKSPMTATVLRRIERPDKALSRLRGNFQHLKNRNLFVGWSDNSYMTEHAADGRLLMEARFQSERFVTYRSYKFEYKGEPVEEPVLVAAAFGADEETSTTVCHISWNGATEVANWKFIALDGSGEEVRLGVVAKNGFETQFHARGYYGEVYAEALAKDGLVLGRTGKYSVETPTHWKSRADIGSHSASSGEENWVNLATPLSEEGLSWSMNTFVAAALFVVTLLLIRTCICRGRRTRRR